MKLAKRLWTYLLIIGLALVGALNYQLLVFPNRFAPAGLNGICTMIQYLFHISVGYLSLLINIPLSLLILWRVGKSLAGRSMLFVVCFSLALVVLDHFDLSAFYYETANGTSKILGPMLAGIINGTIYALLVQCSACTGGIDFVAALIHHSKPEKSFFWITFVLNTVVAVTSFFVYGHELEPVILCIMYSFATSTVSDKMLRSGRSAVHCEIITNSPKEISDEIIHTLHHSATLVPGTGMYLGHKTNVLLCVVNNSQIATLSKIVSKYPHSFAVLSSATCVLGNFKRIDPKGHREVELLDKGDGQTV